MVSVDVEDQLYKIGSPFPVGRLIASVEFDLAVEFSEDGF